MLQILSRSKNASRVLWCVRCVVVVVTVIGAVGLVGCTRDYYRRTADKQTYGILEEKAVDERWQQESFDITPDPRSRFFDPHDPDNPPLPPDDPTANQSMVSAYGMRGSELWNQLDQLDHVENPEWTVALGGDRFVGPGSPLPPIRKLTLQDAVTLGLIHSRDYQEQVENVYLSSLSLTFERYLFDVRPSAFGSEPTAGLLAGFSPGESGRLELDGVSAGVRKLLPTGAQLMAEMTNNTIWMFSGTDGSGTAGGLAFSLVQPLLAGSQREVVLENLTQAERKALYSIRNFARFRRDFYVTIVTGERAVPLPGSAGGGVLAFLIRGERSPTVGFYFMLYRLQTLRNVRDNVASLQSRVNQLRALAEAGRATSLDVTQLESSLQRQRMMLLIRERVFLDQLDRLKLQLGLPPDMELELDDSLLEPFRLTTPIHETLEKRLATFTTRLTAVRADASQEALESVVAGLQAVNEQLEFQAREFDGYFKRLDVVLPRRKRRMSETERSEVDRLLAEDLARFLDLRSRIGKLPAQVESFRRRLSKPMTVEESRVLVGELVMLREELVRMTREFSSLLVTVRLELIEINPVEMGLATSVQMALDNRLDLMNRRAFVMDARRRVELAANQLQMTVDLVAEGEANTRPLLDNGKPFDFRGSQSDYRLGVRVTTPLDRQAQRNNFRASQVSFQRARRNYMAAEDQVKLDVRYAHRRVEMKRRVFEINRRAVRVAARELDQAVEFAARPPRPGQDVADQSSQGVNISRALDNILEAQNEMIETWVDYESSRHALYRDTGTMQIDAQGRWVK
tara:strand:- start:974 stop:3370 length:2397 start_codon:yes stop_codon:yes gene_type:complete